MFRLLAPAVALLLFASQRSHAADPLDFVPPSAQLVVVADNPRQLAEAVTGHDAFKKVQNLGPLRGLYDSVPVRRALQLLAYAEKDLGGKWPELLDQLAGNGAAVAVRFEPEPVALLVLSGKDEKRAKQAFALAVRVLDEELARQGSKEPVKRGTVEGADSASVGNDIHFARSGAVLLVSNNAEALEAAVKEGMRDQNRPRVHPARTAARGILPKSPLAWLWFDLKSVKESKASKDFFDSTQKDFLQTLIAGTTIDCVRRSDFLAVGLYQDAAGFRAALRLPAGRKGMWDQLAFHVPPKTVAGTLPLLEPPGTIYSHSLHLDVAYLWKNREKLLNDEIRNNIQDAEMQISRFLPSNVKLGDLLEMWGPYHRVVVVNHDARPYKTEPALKLPAFGYVGSARDPRFGTSLVPVLRSAGLLGSISFGLRMTEHEHEGVKIVAYRFPENKPLADDPDGLRFNFEPCFAVVGEELVLASTVELGKKLVTELKKPRSGKASVAVVRGKLSASGGAVALDGFTEPLVTDAVLGRGIGLTDARKEVADLVAFVKTLGSVTAELDVTDTEYRVDVVWELKKN